MTRPIYRFNDWTVDVGHRVVINADQDCVPMSSGLFHLLVIFCQNPRHQWVIRAWTHHATTADQECLLSWIGAGH